MTQLAPFIAAVLALAGCYGGPFEPVLMDVCDGHLEASKLHHADVGNIGSDALHSVPFDDLAVVDLDDAPSAFVVAARTADGELALDPRAVGVGYLKVHLSAPEGDATWAWFLLDVRDAPIDTTACEWTTACRQTYTESPSR